MNILVWSVLSRRSNRCRSSFEWMSRAGILQITCKNICNSPLSAFQFYSNHYFPNHKLFDSHLLKRDKVSRPGEDGVLYKLLARHTPDLEDLKVANLQVGKSNQNIPIPIVLLKPAPSCRQSCPPIHGNSWTSEFERWLRKPIGKY